jgi:DNA invertase Pin-like site-specific DNA recombinase
MKAAAAVYLRVSKAKQETENQRPDVMRVVRARGLTPVLYVETASAAGARPVFDRLMADAAGGAFRVLVVWALDRFGRSMARNVRDVLELDRLGVQIVSVREPWLDTGAPARDLLLAIFSWVAEQERARIVERTLAGMARAAAAGRHPGRPPRADAGERERVYRLHREGGTVRDIARAIKMPRATVARVLAAAPTSAHGDFCRCRERAAE